MHVFNESNVFILFQFFWGCYGGAFVFLGGAGAFASPSLAPPMNMIMWILMFRCLLFFAHVKWIPAKQMLVFFNRSLILSNLIQF